MQLTVEKAKPVPPPNEIESVTLTLDEHEAAQLYAVACKSTKVDVMRRIYERFLHGQLGTVFVSEMYEYSNQIEGLLSVKVKK